jgi:hypothetical protein
MRAYFWRRGCCKRVRDRSRGLACVHGSDEMKRRMRVAIHLAYTTIHTRVLSYFEESRVGRAMDFVYPRQAALYPSCIFVEYILLLNT